MNPSASSPFLVLSEYDLDFCQRLALSPKSDIGVKRMARLLLEMHRYPDAACLSQRTGISTRTLTLIRQRYEQHGLPQVLDEGLPDDARLPDKRVTLTEGERDFCQKVVQHRKGSAGRQRRARAMLLLHEGLPRPEIAKASDVCERTLERLVDRYQTHGVEGAVNDAERSGRPVRYPQDEFVPLIQQIVSRTQPATLLSWTMQDLRQSLARHRVEAAKISEPTLRMLMRLAGIQFRQRTSA